MKTKTLPENTDARKFAMHVYDTNEDKKMQGGEMYLFFKFATFFKSLTRSGVHLIYQRNLNFDVPSATGNFIVGLFKEE